MMSAPRDKLIVGNKWLIALPVMLAALTAVLDASIVNVALPKMQSTFGSSVDEIDWVITGYLISNVIIIPTTGWLSGLVGLKRYFILSQVVFLGGSLLCGFSWNLSSLVFFRIVQGIGGGAILPVTLTILLEAFPPQEFSMASALYGIGATLGPAIGPTLGGWLTDTLSWQWIFFVNGPLVVLSIFLSQILIGENRAVSRHRGKAPIDAVGLAAVAVWLGALQFVLQNGQRDDWFQSPTIAALSAASCIAFVWFVVTEMRAEHPLINIRIFYNRNFALGSIAGAVLGATLFGAIFLIPLFAGSLLHYTALQIGLLLLPAALVSLVIFPLAGRLGTSIDPRFMLAAGTGLFFLSLLGNSRIDGQSSFAQLAWLQVLRGASLPFLFTSIGTLALTGLQPREKADGSSLFNLTRTLGGSIGIALLGAFVVSRERFHFERFGESLTQYATATRARLDALAAGITRHSGADSTTAAHQATAVLSAQLTQAAFVSAFDDASLVLAVTVLLCAALLPFFQRTRGLSHH
ncbi:MAG: DHA2 family efflux MFS transporter permease subunit [Candidatus Eremiobacteraeota bacterium]|nr:DHA2 family efflux MFS transporter permease subunit [Candidatus Eremiobacteraeota bacterium]MBC5826722.1 DHA2 family efflux MFS transporter permease subunit [Candidatus Eremiobacteraeota bacterium]